MNCEKIKFNFDTESKIILLKCQKRGKFGRFAYGQHLLLDFLVSTLVSFLRSAPWSRLTVNTKVWS